MRITWTERAMDDRIAIFDKVSTDSFSAAVRLDDEFETQVQQLATFPESGRPGRVEGTREFVYVGLPYIAAHRIVGNTVDILRLIHGAQPWPDKLSDFE